MTVPTHPALAARTSPAATVGDAREVRRAFSTFPTGVTVLTVGGPEPHGMTASSFTPVSLAPPLVLVCVDRSTRMHGLILTAAHFAVSVLSDQQKDVAAHFADPTRPSGLDQFTDVSWALGPLTHAPLIQHAEAVFECELRTTHDAGDHSIVVGEVVGMARADLLSPLLFAHGALSSWRPVDPTGVTHV